MLAYCTTPHAATNVAPCELLMNRKIRTQLDLLYPDVESRVAKNVSRQKAMRDVHAKAREILVGQQVMLHNLRDGPKWVPGVVVGRQGPSAVLCCANCWWRNVMSTRLEKWVTLEVC